MSVPDFYGCYWPDHSPASNMTACNAGATDSWCCDKNDICLDNGYCLQTNGAWSNRLGRGACTDNTWSSNACPQQCSDLSMSSSTGLYLAYDVPHGNFCCKYNYDAPNKQCTNGTKGSTQPFSLPDGNVIYNRTNGATILRGSLTMKQLNNSDSTSPSGSTASVNSTVPASSATPGTSSVLPVALGISLPLGLSLLAALIACALLFVQNRRLKRAITQNTGYSRPSDASALNHDTNLSPVSRSEHIVPMEKGASTSWQSNRSPQHTSTQGVPSYVDQSPHTKNDAYYAPPVRSAADTRIHELAPSSIGELPANVESPVRDSRHT